MMDSLISGVIGGLIGAGLNSLWHRVYSANRLADLLSGPLGQPGRALVELRRLADRYPGSAVGDRAREAIKSMKSAGSVDLWVSASEENAKVPDPPDR